MIRAVTVGLSLAAVGLEVGAALAGTTDGAIEVRITDHAPGIGAFKALTVSLAEVAVHRRGAPRRDGWIGIAEHMAPVDLVPLKDGRWAAAARTRLAAGAYDAIRVRFASVEGSFHSDRPHPIVGHDATIALEFAMPSGGFRAVLVDLYVEDQTDHEPPRYVVKVRRVGGQEQ